MFPPNFIASIHANKGFHEDSFVAIHQSNEQVTSIRLNSAKVYQPQQTKASVPWCTSGFYLSERPSFTLDPAFHAGAYYVQEASSMFLAYVVEQIFPHPKNTTVLDVCAAPGGKSTLLANYFKDGLVVANEVIKSRAAILTENVIKWGTPNLYVTNNDPAHFAALPNFFDLIVADAPCSGSGMFRKDKTAMQEWSLDNVQLCSKRQQRILADVLPSLKDEGFIIYSTCSYSKEENEDVLDFLCNSLPLESVKISILQEWGIIESLSDKSNAYGYRFYPNLLEGEGFFIAVLRKKTTNNLSNKLKINLLNKSTKQEVAAVEQWIDSNHSYTFFTQSGVIRAIYQQHFEQVSQLAAALYIKKAGIGIAEIKGKDVNPVHELAVSTIKLSNIASLEADTHTALQYLKRKDFEVSNVRGWVLMVYNNIRLGWFKALPNRINNYYPQEWRILKD